MNKYLTDDCINCNKFSHCNNNDLICISKYKIKEQELKNICKAFDIEYAIDEETGNLIGRCNKLYKKEQECEKLKKRLESFQKDYSKLYQVVENKGYIKELDQLKAENDKLKQTLDKIEKTCLFKIKNRQFVLPNVWQHFLNIINIAKENK